MDVLEAAGAAGPGLKTAGSPAMIRILPEAVQFHRT
jgi:hypothetical protein